MAIILVVDDDRMIRSLLENCLRNGGHQVLVACNGREALEMAREHNFDLVLMDMNMPEVNGWTASRMIKDAIDHRIQIIAITSYALPGDKARAAAAGCTRFIGKPIDVVVLEQAIVDAMEVRRNGDEKSIMYPGH